MTPTRPARDPSPSLHPSVIERHFLRDPASGDRVADDTLGDLMAAVAGGRRVAEAIRDVAAAIMKNEMETVPARHRKVREQGFKLQQPALRSFDAAIERARRDVEAIDKRTYAPPPPATAVDAIMSSEIRAALAVMRPEKRRAELSAALAAGDDRLHAALLSGPAMLSGVEPAELEVARAIWREKRHGPEMERLRRLRAATEDAWRAAELLLAFVERQYDARAVELGEAAERAETAAASAAQQALDDPLSSAPATAA